MDDTVVRRRPAPEQSGLMKRLLVVGWDAADWKIIRPLLAAAEMPNLAGILAGGVHGNQATLYPPLSPMLWTSIATGKRPSKHGVHGFVQPTEDGLSLRPISSLSRTTKTFWNILNQQGKRSIVVGWWPSHPAEPVAGAMVSDLFPYAEVQEPGAPCPRGSVWPPEEAAALAQLRVHPTEISGDILRMFAPGWEGVNQDKDHSVHDLAAIIAQCMTVHAAATDLMERVDWDLAAIYHVGIDHFSHRFMRYHAGKARLRGETRPEWFRDVVVNAYRYHDLMLGRMLELAGPDCGVIVLSDHGFHSDALLPDALPAEAAGPAVEHREFGIFCMRAPGVKRGERIYGASVLDLAPTVLHLFGLPAGADMDGHVLVNAFDSPQVLKPLPSWDDVAGDDGRHPASARFDSTAAAESLKQLVALGYVAPPADDTARAIAENVNENRYNLARALMDEGRIAGAAALLRELLESDGEDHRFHAHLFHCLLAAGDRSAAGRVLAEFDRAASAAAPLAAQELQRRRAVRPDLDLKGARGSPEQREFYERQRLAERATGYVFERLFLRVRLGLAQPATRARRETVRPLVEELAARTGRRLDAALFLAESFAALGDGERALTYTRRALRANPDNAGALALESGIHHAAGRYDKALAAAVDSLALLYFQPLLHCLMGDSLARLGDIEKAETSYRVALAQAPNLPRAHAGLARLLRRDPARLAEAALHRALADTRRSRADRDAAAMREQIGSLQASPTPAPWLGATEVAAAAPRDRSRVITVVSGLPRSGTSMMMQMLAAAGIEPYTDHRRSADEDNPRGYLEHEDATRLDRDRAWVPQARGKAVKIVAQLLPHLPDGEEYRVVFMHRALPEVVASQKAMLQRLGRPGGALAPAQLERAYAGQLVRVQQWLKRASNVHLLTVPYTHVLDDPAAAAAKLAAFLGEPFNLARGAAAVERGLRRQVAPD